MLAKIALLLSTFLLAGAATAQPLPCASVAPEVRERVREVGACRDAEPGDASTNDAPLPSGAVAMKLSDGTVVRIPRELRSSISDRRKRAAVNERAPPKSGPRAGESAQSGLGAGGEKASAAPSSEVLAQEPSPSTPVLPGSTVNLEVSDGSLARAAETSPVTTPAPAAAPPSAFPTAVDSAPASPRSITAEPRVRFPIAFSADAALTLGAGVFVGLLLGALLMRQWLLRGKVVADKITALPSTLNEQPVATGAGVSETEVVPEIRFAARLDPGEITIAFASLPDDQEVAIEQSSDQHA